MDQDGKLRLGFAQTLPDIRVLQRRQPINDHRLEMQPGYKADRIARPPGRPYFESLIFLGFGPAC
jgi:hypothetical protein